MKKENRGTLWAALGCLGAFAVWTAAVRCVDVQPIGPQGSCVGFARLNGAVHELTGVHLPLYVLTDWLSVIPAGIVLGFAVLGLTQWIKRKRLLAVDRSILVLGGFYGLVLGAYAFFEKVVINFRPVLLDGVLEPSYPSSTTVLVLCVMPTAMLQMKERISHEKTRRGVGLAMAAFTVFVVAGRFFSGVHWFTDIVGGVLLSVGLVLLYSFVLDGGHLSANNGKTQGE